MPATMSASALLTSWLVSRSRRSARGAACAVCICRASAARPARIELHDLRDDLDKPVVLLAELAEQLDLVLGDELQPIDVVAELVELAKRARRACARRTQASAEATL